jgi:filamentous hemagglutinin
VTAVLQGLAGDNIGQAVAGGLSPYVNSKIKELTKDNDEANIAAHALWGAIEAQAGGNNALAGAAGAAGGEIAAKMLTEQIYGKKTTKDLTASEKETISALSQVSSKFIKVSAGNFKTSFRRADCGLAADELR